MDARSIKDAINISKAIVDNDISKIETFSSTENSSDDTLASERTEKEYLDNSLKEKTMIQENDYLSKTKSATSSDSHIEEQILSKNSDQDNFEKNHPLLYIHMWPTKFKWIYFVNIN